MIYNIITENINIMTIKKTSIHICAAKYGAEKHNRREKEMKHVHPEFSHLNKSWEAEDFVSVADEIRKAKERYSATHFCRKAVEDDNGNKTWSIDKSKPKKMPKNAEPIREGVAVITEDTTMEQMQQLASRIEQRWGIKTRAIYAHLDEGHEHLVTDKDHQDGKYLDTPAGSTKFLWNYHAHYIFDWTDHETGQCISLNRRDLSELQDMLANTFKMERGKKSDKKWRDAHAFKAEEEAKRAKEIAEYTERKKGEAAQIDKAIGEKKQELSKLQKAIDELLSATCVPEESLEAVPFADMTFTMKDSEETLTVKDLVEQALVKINEEINTPVPLFNREEWKKERNIRTRAIATKLTNQLLSVSSLHSKLIKNLGKQLYLDAKQKTAKAAQTSKENDRLKQRISELDEKAIAKEKAKTAAAEKKAQEQTARADREAARAKQAESRVAKMEKFIRSIGAVEAFENWSRNFSFVEEAAKALVAWAHSSKCLFSDSDEQVIGRGIIAKCSIEGLNPSNEQNRQKAANDIADMARETVGNIGRFQWDIAVTRIGQLASEMIVPTQGLSVGGSNGNADELTNWDGTKKRGLGI